MIFFLAVKCAPFEISEFGYGTFDMKIALHFRSTEGPKLVEYPYDLSLSMDRDISMTSYKIATFINPTPDFKAKLLRAGAVCGFLK